MAVAKYSLHSRKHSSMSFFQELKRRNVFRVGIAYVLIAWVLLQGADFALDLIDAPNWVIQALFMLAALALPVVLIFSWVYEMTSEGIKRESEIDRSRSITPQTGRKLDRVIIIFLTVAVAVLLADRFISPPGSEHGAEQASVGEPYAAEAAGPAQSATAPSNRSLAVLPFIAMSNGPDDEYFADGLTEEILNALAQLPELLVTARTSAFHFKGQDVPVHEIASRLGVAHVVEGSVRRSGDRLRVTAQLIRAEDGFHLWSNNYDSSSADTIAVQEDIAEKIATAMNVVLDEQKRQEMQKNGLRDVEAFIVFQRARELYDQGHFEQGKNQDKYLQQANEALLEVQRRVPGFATAWMMHSDLYVHRVIEDATGQRPQSFTDQEIAEALEQVTSDYEQAIRLARTPVERYSLELDLAILNGNWRGITDRIESYLEQTGCHYYGWSDIATLPFGYAAGASKVYAQITACDPIRAGGWKSLARALFWSGDPAAATEAAQRGLKHASSDTLIVELAKGMIIKGQFDEAERLINTRLKSDNEEGIRMMIAAARGDRERTTTLLSDYIDSDQQELFRTLVRYAWIGDRENANRLAAEFDQHPVGYIPLSMSALMCECGAPWDISRTPEFEAKIVDAGLNWPPSSIFDFPLKDW
jgi:TolB-like protein